MSEAERTSRIMRGESAWLMAKAFSKTKLIESLEPRMQYAIRRVGGPDRLEKRLREFTRAWNEAPVVDADEDETFYANILVRAHEPKDGVR